jgi:hypothetical protein
LVAIRRTFRARLGRGIANRLALGPLLVLVAAVLSPPALAHTGVPYWPYAKVLRRIDGARIRVGGAVQQVDAALVTCLGVGPSVKRDGIRRWRHFDCLEAQFAPKRDISFRVHTLGPQAFVITNAHYGY